MPYQLKYIILFLLGVWTHLMFTSFNEALLIQEGYVEGVETGKKKAYSTLDEIMSMKCED